MFKSFAYLKKIELFFFLVLICRSSFYIPGRIYILGVCQKLIDYICAGIFLDWIFWLFQNHNKFGVSDSQFTDNSDSQKFAYLYLKHLLCFALLWREADLDFLMLIFLWIFVFSLNLKYICICNHYAYHWLNVKIF